MHGRMYEVQQPQSEGNAKALDHINQSARKTDDKKNQKGDAHPVVTFIDHRDQPDIQNNRHKEDEKTEFEVWL